MSRGAKVIHFMAHKKRGKTHLIKNGFLLPKVAQAGRGIVIDPHGAEPEWNGPQFERLESVHDLKPDFKGIKVLFYEEKETFPVLWDMIQTHKLSGFPIVFDDLNAYAQTGMEKKQKIFFVLSRNKGIDILCTAHNWYETPAKIFGTIDVFVLGPTNDGPEARADKLKGGALEKHQYWKKIADASGEGLPEDRLWDHEWYIFDRAGNQVDRL
jgi:hypothetical protein